ncbi:NUDIX domain-containing protein [Corynebacterium kutscheri]|uniref:NTP pyrophosphohydrolase n=1 Tax=Corynebacterium kutscheri TaxID=35755 RepID=A0A0F6R0H1_9CORY|nr:NUDIX domain-containing protein [Corynebacterium kutscheri]AKE41737.1 NTP pyrophosphohydrolase [Corynebacterium kutscheri]VEH10064.1 phosphatase [Corynebacterium kutscheri]
MTKEISIAAVVFNVGTQVLSVRKRGTTSFMLPGGKREPGERAVDTAIREIAEELHIELREEDLCHLGQFRAPAANEPGYEVSCDVFIFQPLTAGISPVNKTSEQVFNMGKLPEFSGVFAELAELRWDELDSTASDLAPLSRDVIFPFLLTLQK